MTDVDRYPAPRAGLEPRVFEPVARADTDSWVGVVADVIRFADIINGTEFVPKGLRGSAPATAAAILYGREVGLPPMTSLSSTHVVDGRPAISAEAMRALVLAAGHEIVTDTATSAECVMRGRRRGSDQWSTPIGWSLSMARAAGLDRRDNWQKYPRSMLVARATADLCRLVFPDVIHGFAVVEELEAVDAPETPATPSTGGPPARKAVRRRSGRVASQTRDSRPVAPLTPPGARPAGPAADLPLLPGDPGFDNNAGSAGRRGARDDDPVDVGDTLVDASSPAASVPSRGEPAGEDLPADEFVDESQAVEPPGPDETVGPDDVLVAPRMNTRAQIRMILALFGDLDVDDRDERLATTSTIVGRELGSANDLTFDEAAGLIETLGRTRSNVDLRALVDHIREAETPTLFEGGDV